jgi:hypothetical protein
MLGFLVLRPSFLYLYCYSDLCFSAKVNGWEEVIGDSAEVMGVPCPKSWAREALRATATFHLCFAQKG